MAAPAPRLDASLPLFGPEKTRKGTETAGIPQPVERPRLVPPPAPVLPGERDEVRDLRALLGGKVTNAAELIRALETKRREELLVSTPLCRFSDPKSGK